MNKKKLIILISAVTVLLIGIVVTLCLVLGPKDNIDNPDTSKGELYAPRGITLTETVLSWDSVENATKYVVYVGNDTYETTECKMDLSSIAKERDKVSVVAKADGYADSKKSIEKIYITVVDDAEVEKMDGEIVDVLVKYAGLDFDEIGDIYSEYITSFSTTLFKEGLVASDIENIVTTADDIISSLENFVPSSNDSVSEYVEVITTQISKIVDLDISTYTVCLAIKEIAYFALDFSVNAYAVEDLANEYNAPEKLYEYLENMSNRDIERIAIVLDALKEMYVTLEVDLPKLLEEVDKLTVDYENIVDFNSFCETLEPIFVIKDKLINAVLTGLPTMEEYTEVVKLFASVYTHIAPSGLQDANTFDFAVRAYQEMYAYMHKALSFISTIDAALYLEIKPYIIEIYDIITIDILEDIMANCDDEEEMVIYLLDKAGLTEEDIKQLFNGIYDLVNDFESDPEELLNILTDAINSVLGEELANLDFSIITEDPLITRIISIVNSENVEEELRTFLVDEIKVDNFISYQEGKTFDDLVNKLLELDINNVITYIKNNITSLTIEGLIEATSLNEVVNIQLNAMFKEIIKIANIETVEMFDDLFTLRSLEDVETFAKTYFNINLNIKEQASSIITYILDSYNINFDYNTLINTLIESLGLNDIYTNLTNLYKSLENNIVEFEANYKPIVPYEDEYTQEDLEKYLISYTSYMIFGDDNKDALKDLEDIYNAIVPLFEKDEIVDIVDRFSQSVVDCFTGFSFELYLEDETYQEELVTSMTQLFNSFANEYNNTIKWVLSFEDDITDISKKLDSFIIKYYYDDLELESLTEEFFDMFKGQMSTEEDIAEFTQEAKEYFELNLYTIVSETKNIIDNVMLIGSDVYANYLNNEETINYYLESIEYALQETALNFGTTVLDVLENIQYNSKMQKYFYDLCEQDMIDFATLLETIITPSNKDLFEDIDASMIVLFDTLNIDLDFTVTMLYDSIISLLEEIKDGVQTDIQPCTIEYWHANGSAMQQVLLEIRDSFNEIYPEIEVELVSFGDYTTLRDTIVASLMSGVGPTAAQTYPDHVALYLQANGLASLDDYINDPEYGMSEFEQSQFIEGFWNEGVIYDNAGTRYAMPFNKSTELMYYNADLFAEQGWEVPKTWDEVIEICEAWKETDHYKDAVNRYGADKVFGLGYDSLANLFITLTQQYGATFTSFDANGKGRFNAFGDVEEDTLKSKEAMNWYYSQYKNNNVCTADAFDFDYCSDAFKNGECIMTIGSSAGASYHDGQKSNNTKFTTGVAAVPQKDLDNGQVIQQGTNVSLFKCSPDEELAGWLWLKHMVSYESALTWALETSYFPIRKDVLNSYEFECHILGKVILDDGTVIAGVQSLAAKAKQAGLLQQDWYFTNIAFNGSSKARYKAEALVDLILYGGKTVDQAYEAIYKDLH